MTPSDVRNVGRAFYLVSQQLTFKRVDVHKNHADAVTSARRDTEVAHLGAQHDTAGWLLTALEIQEEETTARSGYVLGQLDGRAIN